MELLGPARMPQMQFNHLDTLCAVAGARDRDSGLPFDFTSRSGATEAEPVLVPQMQWQFKRLGQVPVGTRGQYGMVFWP